MSKIGEFKPEPYGCVVLGGAEPSPSASMDTVVEILCCQHGTKALIESLRRRVWAKAHVFEQMGKAAEADRSAALLDILEDVAQRLDRIGEIGDCVTRRKHV